MTTPDDPDKKRGLYGKYFVRKVARDAGGVDRLVVPSGPLFVLAYAKDPHARAALAAYADSCAADYPLLATDLRRELERTARTGEICPHCKADNVQIIEERPGETTTFRHRCPDCLTLWSTGQP